MVRKYVFLFIAVSVFLLTYGHIVRPSNAQEETAGTTAPQRQTKINYDKSYQDYVLKVQEYKKAHELYVTAKAQYLRIKTQKSESTLMDAGMTVLKVRDEVIIYYLDTLMNRLKDTDGATDASIKMLQTKADEEVKWYETHILSLPTSSSLTDLTEDSTEAQSRKKDNTDKLIYEILLNISYAVTEDYSTRFSDLLGAFTQKFDIIRADTREGFAFDAKKVALIDKYIDEMEIIIERSNDKRETTYVEIAKVKYKTVAEYNSLLKSLIEATQYQKDATFELIETIGEVKTDEVK